MDSLFAIPDGVRRGLPASKATIARSIRMAILEAYRVKHRGPPPEMKAHSTRAVGASSAVRHRAFADGFAKRQPGLPSTRFAELRRTPAWAEGSCRRQWDVIEKLFPDTIKEKYEDIEQSTEIARALQAFNKFAIDQDHYQFVALPFGLATAPRVFIKVMAATMDVLHSRGIVVVPYLDDLLIKAPTFKDCELSVSITIDTRPLETWDLNLVLTALQEPPFEPLRRPRSAFSPSGITGVSLEQSESEHDLLVHKPVSKWTPEEVVLWLEQLGPWASHYKESFLLGRVNGRLLLTLAEEEFSKEPYSIQSNSHRKAIIMELERVKTLGVKPPQNLWEYKGKHRVTMRGPALSNQMFTLVTGDLGIIGRWRAVCVTALQRPNSDAAAIDIVVGIAAASLSVKAVNPGKSLFLLYALKSSPRLSMLYMYLFDYSETFLPFIHTTCPLEEEDEEDIITKFIVSVALSALRGSSGVRDLQDPTWTQWREFLVKYVFLPYQLLAEFAWDWLEVHYWTSRFIIVNAMLLTVLELFSFWRLWSNSQLRVLLVASSITPMVLCPPIIGSEKKILRSFPRHMWGHFWKMSTQGLFVAIFWPVIPQFVCNCLFYWALYFNPIINIDLVVKKFRRLETQAV
ncbi:unnamed protein product [Ranitomeya imitator]|uniref:SAM domain-containing protein n=1 Tax=Ranitomeya imitator TaxID=111125 RepID=A0ABN9KUD4_9NEOB|nr:unnamed protein product [Ranitomeya imitator]